MLTSTPGTQAASPGARPVARAATRRSWKWADSRGGKPHHGRMAPLPWAALTEKTEDEIDQEELQRDRREIAAGPAPQAKGNGAKDEPDRPTTNECQ